MSDQSMTVAVTGATGFVGHHVVRELLAHGHSVRALVRTPGKATEAFKDAPNRDKLTLVQAESVSEDSASRLVEGADACVNCIGIIREQQGQRFDFLHVRVPELLTKACRSHGVDRFVQISALGADPDGRAEYQKSKYAGEKAVRRSGIDWTIFRPSLIHGADGEFIGMVRDWTLGRAAPRFFIPYFAKIELKQRPVPHPAMVSAKVAPVGVDDVARAIVNAMERPEARGEVYPLCGPETLDWPELLAAVRDAVPLNDSKKRILPIPAIKGVMAARAAEAVGLGEMLPFGPSEPVMAAEDSVCSVAKAEAHLDFSGVGFREALASYRDQI